MRRPKDPRNHGLVEPKKVFTGTSHIYLSDIDDKNKVSLQTVILAWNKVLKDIEGQGHRITEPPYFDGSFYSGRGVRIGYSYECDNFKYEEEKAAYDTEIASYEAALAAFLESEAEVIKNPPGIDKKIERAKQRLANLEATRDGLPLPFPE